MSARPYHKRYHSDALAGFMSLNLEERGAYQTLLDLIYDRGGPVLDNERLLAGYMGCSLRKWRQLRDALIQKGKISATANGHLTNSRAEKELENDAKTSRELAENGSKGAAVRAENAKNGNENNGPVQAPLKPGSSLNQKPEARDQKEEEVSRARDPAAMRAVRDALGIERPTGEDAAMLDRWLADGADLEVDVLSVCRKLRQRQAERGQAIGSFRYAERAVRDSMAEGRRERQRLREVAGKAAA